jgi:hypothetical protein
MREGNGMLVTADGGDFNVKKQLLCIMFFFLNGINVISGEIKIAFIFLTAQHLII